MIVHVFDVHLNILSRSKELEGRNKKALIGVTEKCFFCEVIYFSAPTERIRHDTEVLVH